MKDLLTIAVILTAAGSAVAQCSEVAGNYYCSEVQQIIYNNLGFSGTYNAVTSFNSDGQCSSTPQSFSGSLAPLDEELSFHFRGPVNLKQFGVYTLGGSTNQKRDADIDIRQFHGHHVHELEERDLVVEYVYVTQTVIDVNGVPTTVGFALFFVACPDSFVLIFCPCIFCSSCWWSCGIRRCKRCWR
jgi:hypothetical protein